MSTYIRNSVIGCILFALIAFGVALIPNTRTAHAEDVSTTSTTDVSSMLARVQELLKLIANLQEQLRSLQNEVHDAIKDGLQEGMSDEDIKKVQELLASDRTIYPEGITSGYFGPLTRHALMRFQERHDLEATGRLDADTRTLIEEYLKEKNGTDVPPGLLRAPGLKDKVEQRIRAKCTDSDKTNDRLCRALIERLKNANSDDDSDDSMSDDSSDDSDQADDSDSNDAADDDSDGSDDDNLGDDSADDDSGDDTDS